MQNQFLFPGIGKVVRQATSSTNNIAPEDTSIETAGYSEWVAAHDCIELLFAFVFAAAATGSIVIQRCADPTAAVSETHETVTITASRFQSWAAGETLLGYYRILNSSGQTMTLYHNKRMA